jgi:hypothetical protein
MEKIYNKIEELLIGDEGIVTKIRFGKGLDQSKISEFYNFLNLFLDDIKLNNSVSKAFFILIMDCIMSINSCIEINNDKESIISFLDELTENLRNI